MPPSAPRSSLNLSFPGLAAVASAAERGDLDAACEELATYYATSNTSWWLRHAPVKPGTGMVGGVTDAMVLHDVFYLAGVGATAHIPRNADGGLDWIDRGPRDDPEFMNCLNRHDGMGWLLTAWLATGNPIYATYYDALVLDWVSHNPCPDALATTGTQCVPAGVAGEPCKWGTAAQRCKTGTIESPWRSLEMGIRMGGVWPVAFFGMQHAAEFSTSARVLLVLAVAEHNAALAVDGGHPGSGTENWGASLHAGRGGGGRTLRSLLPRALLAPACSVRSHVCCSPARALRARPACTRPHSPSRPPPQR